MVISKYVESDPSSDHGEYWKSLGIWYMLIFKENINEPVLCGLVKSKQAGVRILQMVKDVLGKEEPLSWFDYCYNESSWSQFKFRSKEFRLDKLDELARQNGGILTKDILIESKIKNI